MHLLPSIEVDDYVVVNGVQKSCSHPVAELIGDWKVLKLFTCEFTSLLPNLKLFCTWMKNFERKKIEKHHVKIFEEINVRSSSNH